ncbi:hypothetical protein [Methylobacterium sp. Leaf85]|uniref:hypothetical protein n=1 Tax=Methylobacterium sp. Leaf85 TaxID=1736241 RepID=UPI0006F5016F|nr:hypothetical protein [Methylobacterium sp. Leaf85]KQO49963.1 hypothetical protein ASF08_22775 [Methylobacterium sp. Leaf85]
MSNVHTFQPKRSTVERVPQPSPAMIRAEIEAAALAAMDAADRLIAILDGLDGDETLEDGGDAEPSLGAPEQHHGSQVVWLRGSDTDREISQQDATR